MVASICWIQIQVHNPECVSAKREYRINLLPGLLYKRLAALKSKATSFSFLLR